MNPQWPTAYQYGGQRELGKAAGVLNVPEQMKAAIARAVGREL